MIDTESWRQILRVFFTVRKSVENVFAGEYRSVFRGHGLEFEEVREYVPGDDVRNIDWKVTARYGRPFIKKFIEERELTIIILLDASASLDFGTAKSKREVAAEITALLAWSAIANNDRIGLLAFSDHVEKYVRPMKGRHQILKLIREVLAHRPRGKKTDIKAALEYLYKITTKRAIIFVISDFYDEEYEKPLKILAKRHDVVPVVISDPWEEEIGLSGGALIEDAEAGGSFYLSAGKIKEARRELHGLRKKREETFRSAGIDYVSLSTARPYIKELMMFFKRRFARR